MFIAVLTCLLIATIWFVLVIWGAWTGWLLLAGIIGMAAAISLVRIAIAVGGPQPYFYAPVVGVSLFFGAALTVIGLLAIVIKGVVRRRDG